MRFNGYRALTALSRGQIPGPEAGLAKVTLVNAAIAATDLGADVVGPDALDADSEWSYLISFLPGLKSAGGTEQILRNTIGERVLGLPPEPRLDKGVPFSELRAKEKEAAVSMNFALSDEQVLLREAARGALSRFKTVEAARDALEDDDALPDLWPTAVEAGWPGLLIDEEHGGAGLGAFDALLVAEECGRVLASIPLLGLLPATAILNAAGDESLASVAAGELRPAYVPARPPSELESGWTVEPRSGVAPGRGAAGDHRRAMRSCSTARWRSSPMRPGADLLVAIGETADGEPVAVAVPGRRRRRLGRVGHALRRHPVARARQLCRRRAGGGSRSTPACSRTPGTSRRR